MDGVINRRTSVDGREYGIGFAIALPEQWNHDFPMQGGGGLISKLQAPLGASLDFACPANGRVAETAKQIIARHYDRPDAYSYFVGCSTGGREGVNQTQRYPACSDGVVSGAPAIRRDLSNLADRWVAVLLNQIAPKDAGGKPMPALSASDKNLLIAFVPARGRAVLGRGRPLRAYPKHAQYGGQGDPRSR